MMHDPQQSDPRIRAMKSANKPEGVDAESMEQRRGTEGNTEELNTCRTQRRASVPQRLEGVRERAKRWKKERFTALLHHVEVDLLRDSYWRLKRDAAPGVDRQSWAQYGQQLETNLVRLHERVHRGTYRPYPSRRVYIPKESGGTRPLGIAALEDKIVQRALAEVLNAIYEVDFRGFSYGFRSGRSQHDALDALATAIKRMKLGWIVDLDLEQFFDRLDHSWLVRFLEHRIGDRRVIRLIQKWLKAGVMDDGQWMSSESGSPQGAVISPLLSNVFLHYVFDLWAERWRRCEGKGNVVFVRYADDIVAGFQHEAQARKFLSALRDRLKSFALTLHPKKTRVLQFGRFAARDRAMQGLGKPETFAFLGFTHICDRHRDGSFQLRRETRRDRMRKKLREVRSELKRRMHHSIGSQGEWLGQMMRGYFAYHAVPTNSHRLMSFRYHVVQMWRHFLRRRSQKDHTTWARMDRLKDRWLPRPIVLHPWPEARFLVKHPKWEPSALIAHVRIWGGGAA